MDSASTAVDELARLVGWSDEPKYMPDWGVTERLLGCALPEDFKHLLTVIPGGKYCGAVLVAPPTVTGREGDLLVMFRELFKVLRSMPDLPNQTYPGLPGLLPWARSSRHPAGTLFWLADDGDPNRWPVVLADSVHQRWEQFDVGVVEFLTALVKGEVSAASKIMPRVADQPAYTTYQDLPGAQTNTG